MTPVRLFLWTAAMVLAAFLATQGAPLLGMHAAGQIWNALRLTAPWLSQAGDVIGGAIGGGMVGLLQSLLLRNVRWLWIATLAGIAVGAAHALYAPLALVAAAAAGAIAGLFQAPDNPRWARAQAMAAAWVGLAAMLPFPRWTAAAFVVGAALLSAWGIGGLPRTNA